MNIYPSKFSRFQDFCNILQKKIIFANSRRKLIGELNLALSEIRSGTWYERYSLGQTIIEVQETATEGNIVISGTKIKVFSLHKWQTSEAKASLGKKWTAGKRSD